jgi:DNA gyrase subunit A
MFFTNSGKVYRIKGYEIPEASKQAKGRAIINLLQLNAGERVTAMIPLKEGTVGNLMMATKKGLIKKTDLTEFESIRKVGKIAIKLNEDDELINVQFSSGEDDVLCASSLGKCIRFNEKDVRNMGRTAQGVKCMNLSKDDYIVDMIVIKEGYDILTITSKGYGKRSESTEYRTQSRNGKGVYAGVFNEKTGRLVNLKQVKDDEDIIIVTDNGTLIRTHAENISKIGRATQGVRIMKLNEKESVVSVATSERAEDEEVEEMLETENPTQPENE